MIAKLFGYRLWSSGFLEQLGQQAAQIVCRDVTPRFIVTELIAYLHAHKIERPGYSRMQRVISQAVSAERLRLADLLTSTLSTETAASLAQLLERDDTLSELAALKQDARDFG